MFPLESHPQTSPGVFLTPRLLQKENASGPIYEEFYVGLRCTFCLSHFDLIRDQVAVTFCGRGDWT